MWRLLALVALGLANAGDIAGNDAAPTGNDARHLATAAAVDPVEAARRAKIIDESAGTIDHLRELMCGRVSDEALTIGVTVGADAQELTEKLRAHFEQQQLKVLSSRKTRDRLHLAGQTVGFDFRVESKYDAAVGTSTTAYWQELAAAHSNYKVVLVLGSAHEAPSHEASQARLKRCSTSTDMREADQLIAAFGSACPSPRQRAKVEDQVVAEILETVPSDRLQVYDASLKEMDALKWRGWWDNGKAFITKTTSSQLIVCPGSGATATRALERGLNAAGFGDQNPIPRLRTHKVDHNSAREFLRTAPEDDAYDFGAAFAGDSAVLDTPVPGIWPELLAAFPSVAASRTFAIAATPTRRRLRRESTHRRTQVPQGRAHNSTGV